MSAYANNVTQTLKGHSKELEAARNRLDGVRGTVGVLKSQIRRVVDLIGSGGKVTSVHVDNARQLSELAESIETNLPKLPGDVIINAPAVHEELELQAHETPTPTTVYERLVQEKAQLDSRRQALLAQLSGAEGKKLDHVDQAYLEEQDGAMRSLSTVLGRRIERLAANPAAVPPKSQEELEAQLRKEAQAQQDKAAAPTVHGTEPLRPMSDAELAHRKATLPKDAPPRDL